MTSNVVRDVSGVKVYISLFNPTTKKCSFSQTYTQQSLVRSDEFNAVVFSPAKFSSVQLFLIPQLLVLLPL